MTVPRRHAEGPLSIAESGPDLVDLAGGLSKLVPSLVRTIATHRAIRCRVLPLSQERAHVRQQTRVGEELLASAENRYAAGGTLREIAADLGIGRERLAALLRARGVRLRGAKPSDYEVREMARLYATGQSLERVGTRLGFSAGTVRNHLLSAGVRMRNTHGR